MSFYDDASLIMYPSGYKEDKIYSLKPTDGSGDLTFTRASSATRVNEQGLIETPSVLSTTEEVLNGDFNGNANNWTLQVGWAYDNNNVSKTLNNASYLLQTSILSVGKTYEISFTISNYVGGVFGTNTAFWSTENLYSANGNYTITATTSSANLYLFSDSSFVGSIDNVSVKEVITNNVPRIDYTGGCGKLLLEPQRTNVATYSNDFSNAAWIKTNSTITPNTTTSPDGTQNASTLVISSSGYLLRQYTASVSAGGSWALSIFAKNQITNFLRFGGATPSGTDTYSIQDMGNGWYRHTLVRTFASANASFNLQLIINEVGTHYIYGGQIEQGSYATSYIPTSGATVTRLADSANSLNDSLSGGQVGSFFVELVKLGNDADASGSAISITDNSGGEEIRLHFDTPANTVRFRDANNGFANIGGFFAVTNNTDFKMAFSSNGTTIAVFGNGSQIGGDYTIVNPLSFDKIIINGRMFKINQLLYFPTALSDTELATLTTL